MESGTSILIDHYRNPRRRGVVDGADLCSEVHNRKCGDRLSLTVRLQGARLEDIRFDGQGCMYCLASASVMCRFAAGRDRDELLKDVRQFRAWLQGADWTADEPATGIAEEMRALGEVKAYPMRIGCADMAWKGLETMLEKKSAG